MPNNKTCLQFLLLFVAALLPTAYGQQYSGWSTAAHLPGPVNLPFAQTDPFISRDGLSLYFACQNCPGVIGDSDLYVSRRDSVNEQWGAPENLGPNINTSGSESRPVLSLDGHRLYFASSRPGGLGNTDIYVSRRHDARDAFAWGLPENVGEGVNSSANEAPGSLFEDDATGLVTLYFQSDRLSPGFDDIFTSALRPDDTFGPAMLIGELSSAAVDRHPSVRRDGLEIYFMSNRPGSLLNLQGKPSFDLWTSTRASTSDPWSPPVNMDPEGNLYINTGKHDGGPRLSFDGTTLYFFAAQRAENVGLGCPAASTCYFDIWMTTREKLTGREEVK